MDFDPVVKGTVSEEILARILDMIKEKRLLPGDKLPPERELAGLMRVSRPSLREALRVLSVLNVIEIRQGDGTYVSSLAPDILVKHLSFVFSLNDRTYSYLFEARKVIEVGIIRIAALRITDNELAELEICLDQSANFINDHEKFLNIDIELHARIIEAAKNPILTRLMESISELALASRKITVDIPGVAEQVHEDHKKIIKALKEREQDKAAVAMLQHLEYVNDQFEKELESGAERHDFDLDSELN